MLIRSTLAGLAAALLGPTVVHAQQIRPLEGHTAPVSAVTFPPDPHPLAPRMTSGRQRYLGRQKLTFGTSALLLALFGYWIANLR